MTKRAFSHDCSHITRDGTLSDWPEKHCVFALWKRVSSGGYALTFVRVGVEGTFSLRQFMSTKNVYFINLECCLWSVNITTTTIR